jgi:hypothetical protein
MGTVIAASETADGGGAALKGDPGGPTVYEETYSFIVQASSPTESRTSIITSAGLPIPNFSSTAGGLCICRSVTANRRPSPNRLLWDVTATFSTAQQEKQDRNDFNSQFADPATWTPVARVRFQTIEYVDMRDASSPPKAAISTAGEPLMGGFTRRETISSFDFKQYYSATLVNFAAIANWNNKINSTSFSSGGGSFASKTLLLEVKDATLMFLNGFSVWGVEFSLKYRPRTWAKFIMDQGTYHIFNGAAFNAALGYRPLGANGIKVEFQTKGERHVGLLKEGEPLPDGDPPEFLEFQEYESINFITAPPAGPGLALP